MSICILIITELKKTFASSLLILCIICLTTTLAMSYQVLITVLACAVGHRNLLYIKLVYLDKEMVQEQYTEYDTAIQYAVVNRLNRVSQEQVLSSTKKPLYVAC